MRGADGSDFALLQDAEQFRLQFERHLADFVEKGDASLGRAKHAERTAQRTGERSPFVAEQLAFGKRRGQGRAVDRHERFRRSRAAEVQHASPDFLAGAGFAGDQHGAFDFGRPHGMLRHATDRRIAAQHPIDFAARIRRTRKQRMSSAPGGDATRRHMKCTTDSPKRFFTSKVRSQRPSHKKHR